LNFLYGVFVGLIVREVMGWLPRLSLLLVNRGLRKVPEAVREQRREEWMAEHNALPDAALTRIAHGLFCNVRLNIKPVRYAASERLFYFAIFLWFARSEALSFFKEPVGYATLKERWHLMKGIWNELLFDNPKHPYPMRDLMSKFQKIQLLQELSDNKAKISEYLKDGEHAEAQKALAKLMAILDKPEVEQLLNGLQPLRAGLLHFTEIKERLAGAREKIKANRATS
jgi:hypothetical protein